MQDKFLQALKELGSFLGAQIDKLRKDSNEQFDKLRAEVRESKGTMEIDLTTRAIEKLQDSSNIDINNAVKAINEATQNQTASLNEVAKAIDKVTAAVQSDTSEAHLIRQSNEKLTALNRGIDELKKTIAGKDNKVLEKSVSDLNKAFKAFKVDVPKTDMTPVERGLKTLSSEFSTSMKDLREQVMAGNTATQKLIEAVTGQKIDFPKEFALPKRQLDQLVGSWGGTTGEVLAARSINITTVDMASSSTEYSHTFSQGTVGYFIKLRAQNAKLFIASTSGKLPNSGDDSDYITVPQNGMFSPDNLDVAGKTIYLESDTASQTAEIQEFTLK